MTIAEVKTMLESITGFSNKVVYWAWPDEQAPALPFICYHTPYSNDFGADNVVFYSANHFMIELYTQNKDVANEALVEAKLTESGIYFTKRCSKIESERCYLTTYEIEV